MNAITDIIPAETIAAGVIRVSVPDLRRAVNQTAAVVERRNTIPVLGCLRVVPHGDKLLITATDLDMWLTVECPALCANDAPTFLLPARLMVQILRGAEAGDTIMFSKSGDVVTMRIGQSTACLRETSLVGDFPDARDMDDAASFAIPAAKLGAVITNCAPCISTEETRYYLNGIYLHERDGALAGVATDCHRLSIYQTDAKWPVTGHIIPRKSAPMLARLCGLAGDADITVRASADLHMLTFEGSGWVLVAKTIDVTFPDYTRVIPPLADNPGHAVLSPATLRRFPHAPGHASRAAKLDLVRGTMTYAEVFHGLEFTTPIEAGGAFAVGFNIEYLRAFTAAFGTIRLTLINSGDPARITSQDPNWLGVLMPMRV